MNNKRENLKNSKNFRLISDPSKVAAKYYINRIAQGLFFSIALEKYTQSGIHFVHPVLDIGSGNGIFGNMLKEIGMIDSIDISLDFSLNNLQELKKNGGYNITCGDVISLPIKEASLASVFANCVVASVPTKNDSDIDQIFSEVYRILIMSGLFVLTVPTIRFNRNLIVPKVLNMVGASKLKF